MTEEGALLGGRSIPIGSVFDYRPAKVWLESEMLFYTRGESILEEHEMEGILDSFVKIRGEDDVLRFAEQFGPLRLCPHNLPWTHERETVFFDLRPEDGECHGAVSPESLAAWFQWVETARAILTIAAELHQGRVPNREVWETASQILNPRYQEEPEDWPNARDPQQFDLARLYCADLGWAWMDLANIKPKLDWGDGIQAPRLYLWPIPFAFGALGLQLAQAVTRSHGLAICSGCGNPYVRSRTRPQAGRRNYCPDCGTRAALRDAQRERRAKQRGDHGQEG